jgi:phosphoribosyl 1,2-cyclic phosphodiesterase
MPAVRFRVLGSGSSGNTTVIESGETRILIDAGLGPREMAERLESAGVDPASIGAVVISHEHTDHARGAAAFSRKWGARLMGSRGTYAAAGFGAVDIAGYDVLEPDVPHAIGTMTVTGIAIPHDAAGPLAFVTTAEGCTLGHATDFGHVSAGVVDGFRECDAVLIESNYDPGMLREGPYPWSLKERILGRHGHLSNGDVAAWLGRGMGDACRTVILAHLSRTNNHPDVARMTAEAALRRRGRTEVRLEVTGEEGTDWMTLQPPPPALRRPQQMRLF